MKTVDFLQLWLSMPRETGILNAPIAKPVLILESGEVLSIQAGETLYSKPRENVGPYTEVEVYPTTWDEDVYGEKDELIDHPVAAFVNIGKLAGLIDRHGGIDVRTTLEKMAVREAELSNHR